MKEIRHKDFNGSAMRAYIHIGKPKQLHLYIETRTWFGL